MALVALIGADSLTKEMRARVMEEFAAHGHSLVPESMIGEPDVVTARIKEPEEGIEKKPLHPLLAMNLINAVDNMPPISLPALSHEDHMMKRQDKIRKRKARAERKKQERKWRKERKS